MNIKYYYYISKNKVDMLLGQLKRHSWLSSLKITPKLTTPVIGIETEVNRSTRESLTNDTILLIDSLEQQKMLRHLSNDAPIESDPFWQDEDVWAHGLFTFRTFSAPNTVTYFLWKIHQDSIILLLGSPLNILGATTIQDGVSILGSSGAWHTLLDFINTEMQTGENVLVVDKNSFDSEHNGMKLPKAKIQIDSQYWNWKPDNDIPIPINMLFRHLSDSNGLAVGAFCLRYLNRLPRGKIETVFKIYQVADLERPKDLPKWIKEIEDFPEIAGFEKSKLERIRSIYIGSPIYVALQ
jgi:hypothetical protein